MGYKRAKRRSYRRQFSFNRSLALSAPAPKSALVRFRYCDNGILDAAAGGTAYQIFKWNGMYDPRYAIGGHQPKGYDQWALFYQNYRVVGAKARVTFAPTGDTNFMALMQQRVSLQTTSSASTFPTGLTDIVETPYIKSRDLNTTRPTVLTSKWSAKKWLGPGYKDSTYKCDFGSDPAEPAYLVVGTTALDVATNPDPIFFTVCIDYVAVLTEPKYLAQS